MIIGNTFRTAPNFKSVIISTGVVFTFLFHITSFAKLLIHISHECVIRLSCFYKLLYLLKYDYFAGDVCSYFPLLILERCTCQMILSMVKLWASLIILVIFKSIILYFYALLSYMRVGCHQLPPTNNQPISDAFMRINTFIPG